MALFLEITKGPGEGQKFRIFNGTRIGRTTGEILIQDPRVSGLHAQVEEDENGKLFLVDRGSANGIRIAERKVMKVAMMPGVSFRIGQSFFKVVEFFVDPAAAEPQEEALTGWKKALILELPKMEARNSTQRSRVLAFDPAVELQFLEGIQADTKIVLGYGPRKAGSDVLDIELHDPEAPDIAFEISPDRDGSVRFQTNYPDQVRLNNESVSSDILKSGDRIQVGSSLIEVRFVI